MLLLQNLPTNNWDDQQISLLLAEAYRLEYMFADAPKHLQHWPSLNESVIFFFHGVNKGYISVSLARREFYFWSHRDASGKRLFSKETRYCAVMEDNWNI